jgi:predicted amidohydrolase YtcJ
VRGRGWRDELWSEKPARQAWDATAAGVGVALRAHDGHSLEHAYPFRSLWESGARLAGGSDAPVEELDPLAGLRAAVLRTDSERPAWRPEQAIPADAALHSSIVEPAWLSFDEHRRGRLRAGFDADLVVLDRDPLAHPPGSLADARVVATMVAGEWEHGR